MVVGIEIIREPLGILDLTPMGRAMDPKFGADRESARAVPDLEMGQPSPLVVPDERPDQSVGGILGRRKAVAVSDAQHRCIRPGGVIVEVSLTGVKKERVVKHQSGRKPPFVDQLIVGLRKALAFLWAAGDRVPVARFG